MSAKCAECGRAKARPRRPIETADLAAAMRRQAVAIRKRIGGVDVAALRELVSVQRELDGVLADAVRELRAGTDTATGYSWAEIGRELGTTKQAAQQRFGRTDGAIAQADAAITSAAATLRR